MDTYRSIFLQQSYQDAWDEYEQSLHVPDAVRWDYVILTASNENQAQTYRAQIEYRRQNGFLPRQTSYAVLPDPDGKRVGSGGATLNVLRYIAQTEQTDRFDGLKILVIHSGGDSKRIPQYSACGKIFSPVPRELPDGRASTLFDELIISMSGVAARMDLGGMLVMSGDVLMLFNALQIDFCTKGAAALAIKESPEVGQNHGVFKADADGSVGAFLHKKPVEVLRARGAVDAGNKIHIDTGAVILGHSILNDLWETVKDAYRFNEFVNEHVRLSFYADFLFPMATESTLDAYLKETPEGDFSPELAQCRRVLWNVLRPYTIRLMRLAPAAFIHFGTTREVLKMMHEEMPAYVHLGWSGNVHTNNTSSRFSARNSYIFDPSLVGDGSYIEDSILHADCRVGRNCVISGLELQNVTVPDNTVLHGLPLQGGKFVVRMYGVTDDSKKAALFGSPISEPLWTYAAYPVCDTQQQAVQATLQKADTPEKISLCDSFNCADGQAVLARQQSVWERVSAEILLEMIRSGRSDKDAALLFRNGLTEEAQKTVLQNAENASTAERMHIYHYLSKLSDPDALYYRKLCFSMLCSQILETTAPTLRRVSAFRICRNEANVQMPVRVNWAGTWTDTPPYCLEHGGAVLNAAVLLNGALPIRVFLKRRDTPEIELACQDNGSSCMYTETQSLSDLNNPFDQFSIQKAALTVIGFTDAAKQEPLPAFLNKIGGGFSFVTSVVNVPRGSGLGTSSILAAACVRALAEFFEIDYSEQDIFSAVLCMEQLMSTGGGWQDQVGGVLPGVKLVHAEPGLPQKLFAEQLQIKESVQKELEERFCLVYTGQRRLARNLLREVVGRYIGNDPEALDALRTTEKCAYYMRNALENGDLDGFAEGMEQHWICDKQLYSGCTNTCIEHIFRVCADLIAGKTICGAGGGGFVQLLLKKGATRQDLARRLLEVYSDAGVAVWDSSFYWGDRA